MERNWVSIAAAGGAPFFAVRHRLGVADAAGKHRRPHEEAEAGDCGHHPAAAQSGEAGRGYCDAGPAERRAAGRRVRTRHRGLRYTGYGVDITESQVRFQESIQVIEGLWTTPGFSYEGQYYQVENANLVPPPVQKPHPPMYIAATRTRETQDFAAASGHSGIIGVVLDTTDGLNLCYQLVEGARQSGREMDIGGIPFFRYFYVAETEEQARRDSEAAMNWTMDVNQWRRTYQVGSEVYDNLEQFRRTRTEMPPSFDYLFQHRAFIGNPEQIAAKIRALQDAGVGYFGCNFSFGGMPQDKVLKSMEMFAREVMPEFA